jgi:hypothetical protein
MGKWDLTAAPPLEEEQTPASSPKGKWDLSAVPAAPAALTPAIVPGLTFSPDITPAREQGTPAEQFLRAAPGPYLRQRSDADIMPNMSVVDRGLIRNSRKPGQQPEDGAESIFDRVARITGYESDFAEQTGAGGAFASAAKQAVRMVPTMAKSANESLAMVAGSMDATERGVLGKYSSGVWGNTRDWFLTQAETLRKGNLSNPGLNLPKELQGRLWDNPQYLLSPEWLSFNTGEAAASMAPMVIATVLSGGRTIVGSLIGSAQEAGDMYRELMMEDKADPDRALAASLVFGVAVSGLEKLGLDKVMEKQAATTMLKRAMKSAGAGLAEGTTEYLEEPIQAALQGMALNESPQKLGERIKDALKNVDVIPGSFLLGGGVSAMNQAGDRHQVRQEQRAAAVATVAQADPAGGAQTAATEQADAPTPGAATQKTVQQAPAPNADVSAPATPAAEDVMPYTRSDAVQDLERHYGQGQTKDLVGVFDAIADSWAEREGKTRDQWYEEHLAGINTERQTPLEEPGAAQGEQAQAKPESSSLAQPEQKQPGSAPEYNAAQVSRLEGKWEPFKGIGAQAATDAVSPLQSVAKGAKPLEVVESVRQLPQHLQEDAAKGGGTPTAVYDPQTDTVYMLADAIASPEHAVAMWMHEQGAHVGLRGLLGENLDPFLDKVFAHFGPEKLAAVAEQHGLDLTVPEDQRHAAEEQLASIAERITAGEALSEEEQTLWNQVLDMVRTWLKEAGVLDPEKITDADIARTVQAAVRRVVQGEEGGQQDIAADPAADRRYKAEMKRLFEENLKHNLAWRIKSYLLYDVDPLGEQTRSTAPTKKNNGRIASGVFGLKYDDAVYHWGKEGIEGIQRGLVRKDGIPLDQLMQNWGIEDADVVYDALHFSKADARSKFLAQDSAVFYQGAIRDKVGAIATRISVELSNWAAKVDRFIAHKIKSGSVLNFGSTPEVMQALGVDPLPMRMRQRVLAKIMGDGAGQHGLSADLVKRLPELMAEPVAVFQSGSRATSDGYVILTEANDEKDSPVLVAVHVKVSEGGLECNDIASVYGKDNFRGWMRGQVEERNVLYVDNKKAAAVQVSGGLSLPKALNSGGAKKILHPEDVVKHVLGDAGQLSQEAARGSSKFSDRAAQEAGPRGAAQFLEDGRALIHLFNSADASTIIHEGGHILRRMLSPADQSVVEIWAGVQHGQWTIEAEEKFAKAFERYVYEAKAPTSRLRQIFSTLRNALVRVYGSIRNIGAVEMISPEIRNVFDRMLSTQKERDAEADAANAVHSFHVDPSLNEAQYEAPPADIHEIREYEELMAEAERRATERFDKERRKELRTLRAEWRREAQDVADGYPTHRAMDAIVAAGGMDSEIIGQDYDGEFVRLLSQKRPGLVKRGTGLDPAAVAFEHGYADAHSMIEDMLDVPSKADITQEYMARRAEEHERLRALDRDFGGDYLAVQDAALEILDQLTKQSRERVRREEARAFVDEMKIADLGRERAKAKAARARLQDQARRAFDSGDQRGARRLLMDLTVNDYALREMERALAERDRMERSARTMLTRKIDEDWKQQMRNWAGRFGLGGAREDGGGPLLFEFLASKGVLDYVDQDTIRSLDRAYPGSLSVDQYRDVHRVLRQLVHFGTWDTRIMGEKKAMEFDAVMGHVLSSILQTAPGRPGVNVQPEAPSGRRKGAMGKFMDGVGSYTAELLKPEHIFRQLDNQADMGPVWSACFQPIKSSRDAFLTLGEEVQARLADAFAPVHDQLADWRKKRLTIKEVPRNVIIKKGKAGVEVVQGAPLQLTKEEIVMVALNSGNEGNRNALMKGFQWTEGDLNAILRKLTAEDWTVVHKVWGAIEAIYPHLNHAHRRLTGVDLKRVVPTPFVAQTADGQSVQVQGGYFPLIFDRELSVKADKNAENNDLRDMFQSIYQRPAPRSGFTKERVGGLMAPRLDFGVIARHVLDTAHYATHAVAIRDVQKIVTDSRFREAVEWAWSRPVFEQIAPWLQNVARPAKEERTMLESWFARARRNVQIVSMGWKPFTAFLQMTSLTSTAQKVGFWNTVRGVSAVLTHPWDAAQFCGERSIALRNRRNSFDRDVVDMLAQFDPTKRGVLDTIHRTAFSLIGVVDSAVAYATWQAAYIQAMEQNGWNEEKACEYADMTVRLSQGEGAAMSLAHVQHGSELRKFSTMFYSWFSTNYNNVAEANRRFGGQELSVGSTLELARAYWWLLIAPTVLEQLLRNGPPDDEKDLKGMGASVLAYGLSSLPLIRDMAGPIISGYRFQPSPIADAMESPSDLVKAFQAKNVKGRKVAKEAVMTAGYLWGLPSRQAVTVMAAAFDMSDGKTKNPLRFIVPAPKDKGGVKRVTYGGN